MAGPLQQAGAVSEPSEYATLAMDRQMTGLWTQRSLLRDADVPYLQGKFYGASRYDSLCDGLNREISARLTSIRRPGSSVWNSAVQAQNLSSPRSFYSWKYIQDSQEIVRVIEDFVNNYYNAEVFDVSNNGISPLFLKSKTAGASRFIGVQAQLYMGDGVDTYKQLAGSKKWKANTAYNIGDIIIDGKGNLQVFEYCAMNGGVRQSSVQDYTLGDGSTQRFLILTFTTKIPTLFSGSVVDLGPGVTANHVTSAATYNVPNPTSGGSGTATAHGGDGSFSAGSSYGIQIVALDGSGNHTAGGPISTLVTVPNNDSTINWSWPAVTGAVSYQVWLAGTMYWTTTSTSFTMTGRNGTLGAIPTTNTTGVSTAPKVSRWYPIPACWKLNLANNQIALRAPGMTVGTFTYTPTADIYTSFQVNDLSEENMEIYKSMYGFDAPQTGPTEPTWPDTTSASEPPQNRYWGYDKATSMAFSATTTIDGPTFGGGVYGFGQIVWTALMKPYLQQLNWGLDAPIMKPTATPAAWIKYWKPNMQQPFTTSGSSAGGYLAIMDPNGNIQASWVGSASASGTNVGGNEEPDWNTSVGGVTIDGQIVWTNYGRPGKWYGQVQFGSISFTPGYTCCIIDRNGNLQLQCNDISGDQYTSAVEPSWSTTIGGTVSETGSHTVTSLVAGSGGTLVVSTSTSTSNLTWICMGLGTTVVSGAYNYAYSYHSVDGTVSTASPLTTLPARILGAQNGYEMTLTGPGSADPQVDEIWIWRTAQGQSTLILLDIIPNPGIGGLSTLDSGTVLITDPQTGGVLSLSTSALPQVVNAGLPVYSTYATPLTWTYIDTLSDLDLNALIPAPVAKAGDPPPTAITAPIYHLQRVWGIVDNTVVYSAGPDAVTGNGNTQFPPLNYIAYPERPMRIIPFTTNNGGILVIGTANTYVILGTGTQSNPFYTTIYMPGVGILNYDAVDIIGSTIYLMTSRGKLASIDPSAGYVEIGFPIGDQFSNVTTGVGVFDGFETTVGGALYDPSTTRVTWHEQGSGDTAIYVSDGRWGWFRYSPVTTPESGYVWSPRASLLGGCSFVQSVEVAPGINKLLIAPYGGGPILMRDPSVSTDWVFNAVGSQKAFPFPSYQTIGSITLCESGEIAEVAHIAIKSTAVGAKPSVAVLFGELAATADVPFDVLHVTAPDPPDLPPSKTIYSDRYSTMQNGVCPLCEHLQLKIDYGMQAYPDELLKHSIYGAHHAERKQQ